MKQERYDREISVHRIAVAGDEGWLDVDPTYGTPLPVWVPLVAQDGSPPVAERFPANVKDVLPSRSEAVKQGLVVARNQTRIRMRYRSDIDSSMRVTLHGGTDVVYQIVGGPAAIGRNKELEIVCERFSS